MGSIARLYCTTYLSAMDGPFHTYSSLLLCQEARDGRHFVFCLGDKREPVFCINFSQVYSVEGMSFYFMTVGKKGILATSRFTDLDGTSQQGRWKRFLRTELKREFLEMAGKVYGSSWILIARIIVIKIGLVISLI